MAPMAPRARRSSLRLVSAACREGAPAVQRRRLAVPRRHLAVPGLPGPSGATLARQGPQLLASRLQTQRQLRWQQLPGGRLQPPPRRAAEAPGRGRQRPAPAPAWGRGAGAAQPPPGRPRRHPGSPPASRRWPAPASPGCRRPPGPCLSRRRGSGPQLWGPSQHQQHHMLGHQVASARSRRRRRRPALARRRWQRPARTPGRGSLGQPPGRRLRWLPELPQGRPASSPRPRRQHRMPWSRAPCSRDRKPGG
mmetsp:Transcript_27059/g.85646  ORF Transcript_27059/g.85646 Transcript_27059/m.85646 type:complete len:251 (+) Transcript_27059:503-1255(+)